MPSVLRILDANANRAREALRVMEEAARFLLNDPTISRDLKTLRHDLVAALSAVPGLEANRDTPGDVGTTIKTPAEQSRDSVADVVIAAGKRLSEALRAIEEYGKTLGDSLGAAGFAASVERLRYAGYDIEQRLNLAMSGGRARQWRLCVLLTESLCTHHPWRDVLRMALDAGADCIQLREKSLDSGWLLERACEVVEMARRSPIAPRPDRPANVALPLHSATPPSTPQTVLPPPASASRRDAATVAATVIINDRPDIALLSGADGVHVGQTDLPVQAVRKLAGRQLIVGVSTANVQQADRARQEGADYCGVGPMFPTATKHKDVIVGPAYLRQYLTWCNEIHGGLPHLAIAGIGESNLAQLVAAGVRGIAVSSAVCGAKDPAAVVRALLAQLPKESVERQPGS